MPRAPLPVQVGTAFLAGGAACTGWVLVRTSTVDADIWHLGVAALCLSLAWLPALQHYISTTTATTAADARRTMVSSWLPHNRVPS